VDGICSRRTKFRISGILGFVVIIIIIIIASHAICDGLTFLAPVYPVGLKDSTPTVEVSMKRVLFYCMIMQMMDSSRHLLYTPHTSKVDFIRGD